MQTLHWRNRLKRELAESTVGVRRYRRRYRRRRPFSLPFVVDANRQTIFESVCPDGGRQQFSRTQNRWMTKSNGKCGHDWASLRVTECECSR